MTGTPLPLDQDYDPGSMPAASLSTRRSALYRRPWFVVTAAVVLTVGISVITDLPHRIAPAQDQADQNGVITQINNSLQPCVLGVTQSFRFYRDFVGGKLTPDRLSSVVIPYLQQNQAACSYASGPVNDLSTIEVVHSAAGQLVQKALGKVVVWTASDGNGAIRDIQTLIGHPGDAKALADLSKREAYMAEDRTAALADLARASQTLGLPLRTLHLPDVARLPGT